MVIRSRPQWLMGLVVFAVLSAGISLAHADYAPRWSDEQLVGYSEVILSGRVLRAASAYDPDVPYLYTYVTIAVNDVLKGFLPQDQVVLKQLGGTLDGVTNYVAGQPVFTVGEDVLVFLEVRPRDNSLYTTALWQGKWSVSVDQASGQRRATRAMPMGPGLFSRVGDIRTESSFVERVRAWAGEESRWPRAIDLNVEPAETPVGGADSSSANGRFAFLGPARWHEADSGTPVPVRVHAAGEPVVTGGGFAEIATARALVNGAGSALQLSDGGTSPSRCRAQTGVAAIWISFRDPCGEVSDSGGTLAIGGGWFGSPTLTVNGQAFRGFTEGYVINNDNANTLSFFSTPRCFQDVQLHEVLHASGLGHSMDENAIMFPFADNACMSAISAPSTDAPITGALGTDDVDGLRFIYPGGAAPPPGGTAGQPQNFVCAAAGLGVNCSWNASVIVAAPDRAAATSYNFKARLTQGGQVIFNQNVGNQLTFGGTGAPGTFVLSVAGVLAGVEGPESASQTVTLGAGGPPPGCGTPPIRPQGLTHSVNGNVVTLNWTDGGGCPAMLYEVHAAGLGKVAETAQTTFAAPAPSGLYSVFVIARNANGPSGATAPISIMVP